MAITKGIVTQLRKKFNTFQKKMRRKSTFLFRKKVQPNGADWCGEQQQGGSCDILLKSDPKYNQTAQTSTDTCNRSSAAKVLYCIKSKKNKPNGADWCGGQQKGDSLRYPAKNPISPNTTKRRRQVQIRATGRPPQKYIIV